MKVLVTGGAGFIGTNVVYSYLKKGAFVTVFDNLSRPGVKKNLSWLSETFPAKRLTTIIGDIRDQETVINAIKNQDIIFHLAGQTAVTTSLKNPSEDFNINARGTLNLLEAVRLYNPKAIVLNASTNKVYGELQNIKLREPPTRYTAKTSGVSESHNLDFHSPYGCSKGTADQYTRDYHRIYGLNTIVFRQSCIYGPHQLGVEDQGWLAHFAASAIQKTPITIFGNGRQVRDVLYIDDLIKAYDQATTKIQKTKGEIYNIGGGPKYTLSLLELITLLEDNLKTKINYSIAPPRPGDQKYYVSNIKKAKSDFSWQPATSPEKGVDLLVRWLETFL